MIHRFPARSEAGDHVDTDEPRGLGAHVGGLSGLSARRGREAANDRLSWSHALLHGGERALAGASVAARSPESWVEALRPAARRAYSRPSSTRGFDEQVGASDPDVGFHHRARPGLGGPAQKGAARSGARPLARSRGPKSPAAAPGRRFPGPPRQAAGTTRRSGQASVDD